MTKMIALILLLISSGYLHRKTCNCSKPTAKAVSQETDDKNVEEYIYKKLYGQITALGDSNPIENILVEVYDHPEVALDPAVNSGLKRKEAIRQHKLDFCRTGKEGTFCFQGIKPGKYEIRLTNAGDNKRISGPWENRSWFITLNPHHPESTKKMIKVYLNLLI